MGFRKKVTVRRKTGGGWRDDGTWNEGTEETLSLFASVQPLSAKEYAQVQPEGDHTVRAVKIYTDTELFPAREPDREADRVRWQGAEWQIVQCDPFQSGVISHYRAYALEVMDRGQG